MTERDEIALRRLNDYIHAGYYRYQPAEIYYDGVPDVRVFSLDPLEYVDMDEDDPRAPEFHGYVALHSLIFKGEMIYDEDEFISLFEHENTMYGISSQDPALLEYIAAQVDALAGIRLEVSQ